MRIESAFAAFLLTFAGQALAAEIAAGSPVANPDLPAPEVIHYQSNGLSLLGWVYKPVGDGPFPAVIFNHGSEQNPVEERALGRFWVSQGFVYFVPVRSGHGRNPGPYIADETKPIIAKVAAARKDPRVTANQLQGLYDQVFALHRKANQDAVAAVQWLMQQPWVDRTRVVVAGGSYGGIQTLLTAEANKTQALGIRAFIAMSPAAESWEFGRPRPQDPGHADPEANTAFARYLPSVIKDAEGPIFLMQAHNDYSLGPTAYLGPVVVARGEPSRCAVFPVHGAANDHGQGHAGFFADATAWGNQVWPFLQAAGEVPKDAQMDRTYIATSTLSKVVDASQQKLQACGRGE